MRTEFRGLLGALLFLTVVYCGIAPAQLAGTVRVLGITPTIGVTRVAASFQTLGDVRLTKFAGDDFAVPAAILAVTWEQMPGLAPKDVALQLEYRIDGRTETHVLGHTLPPRERGPRTHRFEIPLTRNTGRRVTAWRLRLMHDNAVLEEYTSAAWR